jgi:hypothetical protein
MSDEPQSPPWKDCNLLEPECKSKGHCVGHSQSPPAGDTDNDEEIAAILSDLILVIRKKEPDLYSLAVVDALLSRPLAQLNAYMLEQFLELIGDDEPEPPVGSVARLLARNKLKAELRQAATARFGAPADKLQGESNL